MAKKKKFKRKKIFLLLFILFVIIISIYIINLVNSNNYKLKKIGYNEEEIIEIVKDKDLTDYLLKHEYDELYLKIVNTKDYKFKNIDKYINYYKNNSNAPLNDIVYIINNDINKEYSENLISILKHKYFIKDRLDRYLNYLNKKTDIDDVIRDVNSNLDYEFYTNTKKTDLSKDYLLIVNKYYYLDEDYQNSNLVTMESNYTKVSGAKLEKKTYEAFKKLSDDARSQGYYILNNSAYRSYDTQNNLYNNYKAQNGLIWADSYSARPGHSEHQTGLALDVASASTTLTTFENTKEFIWMKENSYKYGFILRYPKGKEYITGYNYEAWHYRYVGEEVAKFIYENDLTFEEYYAYYVEKNS